MNLQISSQAPTRIDLAGGTIDIWPIYLMVPHPITVNLGINLYAEANLVQSQGSGKIILKSVDQNLEIQIPLNTILMDTLPSIQPGLELHYKLFKYFLNKFKVQDIPRLSNLDLTLSTTAHSPAGAGLGGSSTLSVAMIGALAKWAQIHSVESHVLPQDGEKFIEIVRDVETTVIHVPAGLQDYYGAMYGGLQSLEWGIAQHHRTYLPRELIQELSDRILLFYSGKSRNSGINNWTLFKDFIDNQNQVKAKFEEISKATHQVKNALLDRNWTQLGEAIANEWETRKTLASQITTPEIEAALAEAKRLTPLSAKICGAGGGGCFFIYLPTADSQERKSLKAKIESLFAEHNIRHLPFQGVPQGLEVQVSL